MVSAIMGADLRDPGTSVPVRRAVLTMPFTMSNSRGTGIGFMAHALIRLLTGRWREVSTAMWPIVLLVGLQFCLEASPA